MFYFISYLNSSTLFFKLINNYFTLNLHIDCSVALTSLSYYGLRCEHGSSADSVLFLNLGVKLKYVAEKDWTTGQNGEIGKIPTSESNVHRLLSSPSSFFVFLHYQQARNLDFFLTLNTHIDLKALCIIPSKQLKSMLS